MTLIETTAVVALALGASPEEEVAQRAEPPRTVVSLQLEPGTGIGSDVELAMGLGVLFRKTLALEFAPGWMQDRLELESGLEITGFSRQDQAGSMRQYAVPIRARVNVLTGPVRPWMAWGPNLGMVLVPEGGGQFALGHSTRAGVEFLSPNRAISVSGFGAWNVLTVGEAARPTQWISFGAAVALRGF